MELLKVGVRKAQNPLMFEVKMIEPNPVASFLTLRVAMYYYRTYVACNVLELYFCSVLFFPAT